MIYCFQIVAVSTASW